MPAGRPALPHTSWSLTAGDAASSPPAMLCGTMPPLPTSNPDATASVRAVTCVLAFGGGRRLNFETTAVFVELYFGISVSGLEFNGSDTFFCGGGNSGKVRAVRRPARRG